MTTFLFLLKYFFGQYFVLYVKYFYVQETKLLLDQWLGPHFYTTADLR